MAHMIDMSNDRANMAYVGDKPWHGLGSELQPGADIDTWRVAAGLNWTAEQQDLWYRTDADKKVRKADSKIICRSDTGAELGIATERYRIVQPATVMEFFRDLTEENGMTMETAGSLEGGKRIWALARTGDSFRLMGQDEVKGYVLLATSFDGSMATQAQFTSIRVVCHNTLSVAVKGDAKGAIRIPHSTTFDGHKVKLDLGLLKGAWSEFETAAQTMAETKVSARDQVEFVLGLMATEQELANPDLVSSRKRNIIADIVKRAQGAAMGSQYRAAQGSVWGLVNAVTEYVDHVQGNSVETRFKSAQFGQGAALKSQAFARGLALAA